MAKPLTWLFQLFDRMSGPSKQIAGAVRATDTALQAATVATQAMGEADKATAAASTALAGAERQQLATEATLLKVLEALTTTAEKHGKGTKEAGEHTEGWRHQLFEWVEVAHRAYEVAERLADKVLELGKRMLEAAGHSERTAMSFKLLLGDEGGEEVLAYLTKIQRHTQFTKAQLESLTVPLVAQGYKVPQLQQLLPAALDVGAMFGGSQEAVAGALDVFTRIKATSRLESRELTRLGLAADDVLKPLAKQLGTDTKGVKERMEAGKIKPEQLLDVIYQAIQAKTGGALGTGALQAGSTMDALINKAKGLPEQIFGTLDTSPAFAQVKGFLTNVLQLMDPEGPYAGRIASAAESLFSVLFGGTAGLSGEAGAEKMARALEGALDWIGKIPGVVREAQPYLEGIWTAIKVIGIVIADTVELISLFGELLGWMAAQLVLGVEWLFDLGDAIGDGLGRAYVAVSTWITELVTWISYLPAKLLAMALNIGSAIWQGVVAGITGGLTAVQDAVGGLADTVVGGLKGLLGISSPSKVTRQLGRYTGQGMALGLTDSASMIDRAWSNAVAIDDVAMASPYAQAELRRGAGRGAGGGITINLTVNVDAHGGDVDDLADAVVERVTERLPSMLEAASAQLAAEWGVG